MKNIKILTLLFLTVIGLTSCLDDDSNLTYIATPTGEFVFSNSFSSEYVLTPATARNLGERFTWGDADFDIQTNVNYELQKSITGDFSDLEVVGSTNGNEISITIGNLLSYAGEAGLDNDPDSENLNTGDIYFRVRAFVGDGNSDSESFTPSISLIVVLPEDIGEGGPLDLSTNWGIVGSAAENGWDGPDMPFYTTDDANVIVAYVTLADGEMKFRTDNAWTLNYGDDGNDGTLEQDGANIPVSAGTYKILFNISDFTYTIEPFTWGLVGDATTNSWDGPDMPLTYDSYSNTWKAIVTLGDGEFKIRLNNDWGVNYGDDGVDGTLEAGGANIAVSAGNYLVTFDEAALEYTIESIDIWGLVGSAAPNGWDGPNERFTRDFSLTDVWVLNGVTLIDGEIKFRTNDSWDVNFGDTGNDGTLEAGGDNIAVSAGTYDIVLDFSDPDNPVYTITGS